MGVPRRLTRIAPPGATERCPRLPFRLPVTVYTKDAQLWFRAMHLPTFHTLPPQSNRPQQPLRVHRTLLSVEPLTTNTPRQILHLRRARLFGKIGLFQVLFRCLMCGGGV